MKKIKVNDQVVIITGKDKGKRGVVKKILGQERVIVQGLNMIKKHQRANPQLGEAGGIIEREAAIHISNVAIFNTGTNKADKVKVVKKDNCNLRVYKSNSSQIDA